MAEQGQLVALYERISRWRSNRKKLHPMPAELWKEAEALARELGVNPVSRALNLNYQSLRRRLRTDIASPDCASGTPVPRFVELSGAQILGLPTSGPVVEVSNGSGDRLTVRLPAGAVLDVAGLVAAFGGRRA